MSEESGSRSGAELFELAYFLVLVLLTAVAFLAVAVGLSFFIVIMVSLIFGIGHFSAMSAVVLAAFAAIAAHALAWFAKEIAREVAFLPHLSWKPIPEKVRAPSPAFILLALGIVASSTSICLLLYYANEVAEGVVHVPDEGWRIVHWTLFFADNLVAILTFSAPSFFGISVSGIEPTSFFAKLVVWGHRIFLDVALVRVLIVFVRGYRPRVLKWPTKST